MLRLIQLFALLFLLALIGTSAAQKSADDKDVTRAGVRASDALTRFKAEHTVTQVVSFSDFRRLTNFCTPIPGLRRNAVSRCSSAIVLSPHLR